MLCGFYVKPGGYQSDLGITQDGTCALWCKGTDFTAVSVSSMRWFLWSRVDAVEGAQAYKTLLVAVHTAAFSCDAGHTSPGTLDLDSALCFVSGLKIMG